MKGGHLTFIRILFLTLLLAGTVSAQQLPIQEEVLEDYIRQQTTTVLAFVSDQEFSRGAKVSFNPTNSLETVARTAIEKAFTAFASKFKDGGSYTSYVSFVKIEHRPDSFDTNGLTKEVGVTLKGTQLVFNFRNGKPVGEVYNLSAYGPPPSGYLFYLPISAPGIKNVRFTQQNAAGNETWSYESCNGSFPPGCWLQTDLCGDGFAYLETGFLKSFQEQVANSGETGEILFTFNAEGTLFKRYDPWGQLLESTVPNPLKLDIRRGQEGLELSVTGEGAYSAIIEGSKDLKVWEEITYTPTSALVKASTSGDEEDRRILIRNPNGKGFYRVRIPEISVLQTKKSVTP